jgi:hypothetical protein
MPGAVIRMEAPVRLSDDRMKQRYAAMSTARGATIMNTASARIIAKEHHETPAALARHLVPHGPVR